MDCKWANWISGIAAGVAIFLFILVERKYGALSGIEFDSNLITAIATLLMALFAFFSWLTAIKQRQSMKQQKDDQDALLIQQNKIMNAQEDIAYRQYLLQRANKLFEVDDMTKEIFNASIDFHKTIVSTTQININIEFLKLWPKVASYAGKLRVFYPVNESLDSITELYNKALEEIEVTKGSKRFNTENREHWQNFYEKYVSAAADKLTNIIEDISEELIKIGIELKNLEKNYIKGAG